MKLCAIILAAGSGSRMKMDTNKVFIKFEEQSAVVRCLKTFEATGLFSDIIVVCRAEERAAASESRNLRCASVARPILSSKATP